MWFFSGISRWLFRWHFHKDCHFPSGFSLEFQWHVPMDVHLCELRRAIFCPDGPMMLCTARGTAPTPGGRLLRRVWGGGAPPWRTAAAAGGGNDGGEVIMRAFSYRGFRKLQSRPWTNLELVGGPWGYGRNNKQMLTTVSMCCSRNRDPGILSTELQVQKCPRCIIIVIFIGECM